MLRKNLGILAAALITLASCGPGKNGTDTNKDIVATIDLVTVVDDKVKVEVNPGKFQTETATFNIPKTVPGTYSDDNYGRYIDDFKAYDYKGNEVTTTRINQNSWLISNAKKVDKVSYWVNDTFDTEYEDKAKVFSPTGSNILENKNFVLNLHAFVGYFSGSEQNPYQIVVQYPKNLEGVTSLPKIVAEKENYNVDTFGATRYAEVTDNPIMYSEPDIASFKVGDMNITLSVYSPTGIYSAESLKENIEKMIIAQKNFLGDVDATKQYTILLYLSTLTQTDASGFGALEHNTSTTVVLPEQMPKAAIEDALKDVVSHEFFHIVTPLKVHSEEIHYFDYNNPKMSKHLWMYEGVTEYFANLFQINQGLIDEEAFYDRINEKIKESRLRFNDALSFTEMSANILSAEYKDEYANVYEKGTLIAMMIDLTLRAESNGETGILDLMQKLSIAYGSKKPFKDNELFDKIIEFTTPELRSVIDTYIVGNTPIPYNDFLQKVGLELGETEVTTGYFLDGQVPYIGADESTMEIFILPEGPLNSFMTDLGLQNGDVIDEINGVKYNLKNVYDLIGASRGWNVGDPITMTVKRNGEVKTLSGNITKPTIKSAGIMVKDLPENSKEVQLRKAWLKN
ncbi:peptidase M61 [uncultured Kordia sp.]|uniref:M61 family metallopeptidase n=1 Tax=uncultured Kordia sp. TaxID=507699 RepID=UPI002613790A|nr:peptidase M61 [uncultured Kordia sp.]